MRKIIIPLLALTSTGIFAEELKLQNPSFEKGTGGYWISKIAETAIDTGDSSHGKQSLSITPAKSGKINVVFFIDYKPDTVYTVSFDSKAEKAGQDTRIQLEVMAQGKKPIMFLQKLNIAPVSPKNEWSSSSVSFGPVKPQALGRDITKFGIYLNAVKGKKGGKIWLDNLSVSTAPVKEQAAADAKKKMN